MSGENDRLLLRSKIALSNNISGDYEWIWEPRWQMIQFHVISIKQKPDVYVCEWSLFLYVTTNLKASQAFRLVPNYWGDELQLY